MIVADFRFITILICSNTIKAQKLYSESGDFYEKSKRSVVDHAKLGVFYELKFRKDSTKLDDYTEAQTVLMVSDKPYFLVIIIDWH